MNIYHASSQEIGRPGTDPATGDNLHWPRRARHVGFIILCAGILLRVLVFGGNRSLWLDEAMLGNNIVSRSASELTKPLDHDQAAPVGFLVIERSVIAILGPHDWALRMLPFLSSVASLLLLAYWCSRLLSPIAGLTALAGASGSVTMIYYGTELKPYSSDAAVAMLVLVLAERATYGVAQVRGIILVLLAISGILAVWISYPAIFVLAAVATFLWLSRRQATGGSARGISPYAVVGIGLLWLGSFGAVYLLSLRHAVAHSGLQRYWQDAFPPLSAAALPWLIRSVIGMMRSPGGFTASSLACVCFLVGIRACWKGGYHRAVLLLGPFVATLLASGLHRYPFDGRLLLFLAPLVMLLIGLGVGSLWAARQVPVPWAVACILALLSVDVGRNLALLAMGRGGAASSLKEISIPPNEDMRSVVAYLRQSMGPREGLLIYPLAKPAFDFYASRDWQGTIELMTLTPPRSSMDARRLIAGLPRTHRKRVWLVFAHVLEGPKGIDDEAITLLRMNEIGSKVRTKEFRGCSIYEYELGDDVTDAPEMNRASKMIRAETLGPLVSRDLDGGQPWECRCLNDIELRHGKRSAA